MFADAYEIASRFTMPVVVSMRFHTGEVACSVGSAIVLNEDGWLVTAAHMLQPLTLHEQNRADIAAYDREAGEILRGAGSPSGRQKRMRALDGGKRWIRNYSMWLGRDEWAIPTFHVLGAADVALGRIERFDPATVAGYPTFRDPGAIRSASSVCRLGFPFHEITATFDEVTGAFNLAPEALPIPRFPNEGIVTRFIGSGTDDGIDVMFIETSTPGLRGQSGGPIFDTAGAVCGMQSKTAHLALGFSPEVEVGGRKTIEHQFMNVGMGVHGQTMLDFFARHGVQVAVS